jgi:hypothetical protein
MLADDQKRLIAMRTKLAESERKLESLELKWIDNAFLLIPIIAGMGN